MSDHHERPDRPERGGHPDLGSLLRGEASNAEVLAAGRHLEVCATCRADLAETVVGHALLARSGVTLGERGGGGSSETALPELDPRATRRSGPVRARTVLIGLAAAAVAVVAVGVGLGLGRTSDDPEPAATPPALVTALAPLSDDGTGDGSVRMVGDGGRTALTLDVRELPAASPGEFYEAWLLDPETAKLLPLGQVDADGRTSFDLDDALVASYSVVDVSLEADDDDPGHSGTSVLRGSYTPDDITTDTSEGESS